MLCCSFIRWAGLCYKKLRSLFHYVTENRMAAMRQYSCLCALALSASNAAETSQQISVPHSAVHEESAELPCELALPGMARPLGKGGRPQEAGSLAAACREGLRGISASSCTTKWAAVGLAVGSVLRQSSMRSATSCGHSSGTLGRRRLPLTGRSPVSTLMPHYYRYQHMPFASARRPARARRNNRHGASFASSSSFATPARPPCNIVPPQSAAAQCNQGTAAAHPQGRRPACQPHCTALCARPLSFHTACAHSNARVPAPFF